MFRKAIRTCNGVVLGVSLLIASAAPGHAVEKKHLLVVSTTTAFRHTSIPAIEKMITQLGKQSGAFTADFLRQPAETPGETPEQKTAAITAALQKLSPAELAPYDGIVFDSTTGDLPIPDKAGFLNWIQSGKAFIGIHSATDTFHNWPEFLEMLGGEFKTHGAQVGVTCRIVDQEHPSTQGLGAEWKIDQEEIYQFKNYDPKTVHELIVMDKHPNDGTPGHYPLAWNKDYGKGKVFYTALGHREDIIDNDPALKERKNTVEFSNAYRKHVLGGILWALGLEKGDSKPQVQ